MSQGQRAPKPAARLAAQFQQLQLPWANRKSQACQRQIAGISRQMPSVCVRAVRKQPEGPCVLVVSDLVGFIPLAQINPSRANPLLWFIESSYTRGWKLSCSFPAKLGSYRFPCSTLPRHFLSHLPQAQPLLKFSREITPPLEGLGELKSSCHSVIPCKYLINHNVITRKF